MQYIQFVPWLIALGSLIVAYKGYSHNVSKDSVDKFDGIKDGLFKANMKLDTVCNTTAETRADIKSLNKDLIDAKPISIAATIDGSIIPATTAIVTPAAVEEFFNVCINFDALIWNGCCETVSIINTSSGDILVQNANIEFDR